MVPTHPVASFPSTLLYSSSPSPPVPLRFSLLLFQGGPAPQGDSPLPTSCALPPLSGPQATAWPPEGESSHWAAREAQQQVLFGAGGWGASFCGRLHPAHSFSPSHPQIQGLGVWKGAGSLDALREVSTLFKDAQATEPRHQWAPLTTAFPFECSEETGQLGPSPPPCGLSDTDSMPASNLHPQTHAPGCACHPG